MTEAHLVVRGFERALRAFNPEQDLPRLPVLERWLARGTVLQSAPLAGPVAGALRGWQRAVLRTLGLTAEPSHASAPLEWLGVGGEPRSGTWFNAELVHLALGATHAELHPIADVSFMDMREIAHSLNDMLRQSDYELLPLAGESDAARCFVHTPAFPQVTFQEAVPLQQLDLRDLMPHGMHAAPLRRMLTEAQMILHEHPVNQRREKQGRRAVNTLWLSGCGRFDGLARKSLPAVAADEAYVQGLCRLYGQPCQTLASGSSWIARAERPVLAVVTLDRETVESRPESPDVALTKLRQLEERWLVPLELGLKRKLLSVVELTVGSQRLRIDRADLQRFWRRGVSWQPLVRTAQAALEQGP